MTHALIALSFRHFPLFKIFSAQCTYSRCCLVRPRALLIALSKNRFISYGPKLLRAEDENFLKFLFGIPRLAPNRFCVFLPRVKAGISITSCHRRDLPQKITQQDRSVQKGKRRDLKENRSILLRSFVRFLCCSASTALKQIKIFSCNWQQSYQDGLRFQDLHGCFQRFSYHAQRMRRNKGESDFSCFLD